MLGPRPFPMKKNLVDYLEELRERINEDEETEAQAGEESDPETGSDAEQEGEAEKETQVKEK